MDIKESLWQRGRRDTVIAAKSFPFIVAEVGGSAVTGILSQNPWVTLIYFLGLLVALFIGVTVSAPVRQRDEARMALGDIAKSSPHVESKNLDEFIRSRDQFTLKEAACIKAEVPITHGELVGPASGYLHDLKKMVISGEIRASKGQVAGSLNLELIGRLGSMAISSMGLSDADLRALENFEVSKEDLKKTGFIT